MKLDFAKGGGLVPAIVQDSVTGRVLMLGFMNEQALDVTEREKRVTFFSRTKQRLWTKGESSGHYLAVDEIRADCDSDTVLIKARPAGPACHTGSDTCFGEQNRSGSSFLNYLERLIAERRDNPPPGSYTAELFSAGVPRIAQKVGEEAVESVIAALGTDRERFTNEAADLIYHLLVLLRAKDVGLDEVVEVLEQRHKG